MNLKNQILCFGLAGALMAGFVGAVGLVATQRQTVALGEVLAASESVRESMDGDMMHDAIRGDVMAAVLAARDDDAKALDEARRSLGEHRQRYAKTLDALGTQPLPTEVRALVQQAHEGMTRYGGAAEKVQSLANGEAAALQRAMDDFNKHFDALEASNEALGDAIEKHAAQLAAEGQSTGQTAQLAIGLGLVVALASMAGMAPWLARRWSRPIGEAVKIADRIAQGDLTVSVPEGGQGESALLMASLARMKASLGQLTRELHRLSTRVATASDEMARGSESLSRRNQTQAASLNDSTTALERLGAELQNNLAQTREANALAASASSVAERGGSVVAQVVDTMRGINESSSRIADIIGVIDGIAFQTNILALNAAVEAARAGEQGRGFAVVAAEVRSLAQRSANAAKEIKSLITTSVQRVDHGSTLVDQAGQTMQEIVDSIQRVSRLMGQITEATLTQAGGISGLQDTVRALDTATHESTALAEQGAGAAAGLMSEARELVRTVSAFKFEGSTT
jgi:methyl-accepting chemotaxis protein